jgi:AP-3 complex subunit sigma
MLQVHYILQEIVMGGMVLETNMGEVMTHIEAQNKLEKSETSASSIVKAGVASAPTRAVAAMNTIKQSTPFKR